MPPLPRVAIYNRVFLNYSQTFIYRQLLGVRHAYEPVVLTRRQMNQDQFDYQPLYTCGGQALEDATARLLARSGVFRLTARQQGVLRQVAEKESVTLIHAHFGPSGLEMMPVARSLDVPLVVTFHGFDASTLLHRRLYRKQLKALFASAYVITVSDFIAQRLRGLGADPARMRRHYIGVPVEQFDLTARPPLTAKKRAGERIEFLQVSGFVAKKGHRYTVEAFANLLQSYPNCHLTFAGSGPTEARVKEQCRDLGISDKVQFMGSVPAQRVVELMAAADIFVHHSVTTARGDEEGIPTVLMEAMATGLVVIATRHAGIPELVQDGVNGFLVEERDIGAYSRMMVEALDADPRLGIAARDRVLADFNLSKQNAMLAGLYAQALSNSWNTTP